MIEVDHYIEQVMSNNVRVEVRSNEKAGKASHRPLVSG